MFRFPGEKVKAIAVIFFVLNVVLYLGGGIYILINNPFHFGQYARILVVCAVLLLILIAYILSVILYAFGSLVSDTEEIKTILRH